MTEQELKRLNKIEKRIKEIAEEFGLLTTDVIFEIAPIQKMLEGMAYYFPVNFSHWSFGRDYEKYKTIYKHTGEGISYEQVWNLEPPKAYLVEKNPFGLTVLTIAHVYGHIDFFLGSQYTKHGRSFSDLAEQARNAAVRFKEYEAKYGKTAVEKTIDAAMSIMWNLHPDPFLEEELDNEIARERLLKIERAKLERTKNTTSEFKKPRTKEEIEEIERKLKKLARQTPPRPIYNLLNYIAKYSAELKPWQKDILNVISDQAASLSLNAKTKMLNEGWATFWHVRIMRKLFEENLITAEEHGVFNEYHARVTREDKLGFNWYRIGMKLFEYIKELWDKGRFGKEYEECKDPIKRAYWDRKLNKGMEKIFEVRSFYSNKMAIDEFFTDEFIKSARLYIYQEEVDPLTGEVVYRIVETSPQVIKRAIKTALSPHGNQLVYIQDSNYNNRGELYLVHKYYGLELDPLYRKGTMVNIYRLWGRPVHLETVEGKKPVLYTFDGKNHEKQT